MHVAAAKNELDRVSGLIKSMVCITKAIERQAIVSSMLASTVPPAPLEGDVSPVVENDSSRARKRVHDEVSFAPAPSSAN